MLVPPVLPPNAGAFKAAFAFRAWFVAFACVAVVAAFACVAAAAVAASWLAFSASAPAAASNDVTARV